MIHLRTIALVTLTKPSSKKSKVCGTAANEADHDLRSNSALPGQSVEARRILSIEIWKQDGRVTFQRIRKVQSLSVLIRICGFRWREKRDFLLCQNRRRIGSTVDGITKAIK
jgi:hypothetical protein